MPEEIPYIHLFPISPTETQEWVMVEIDGFVLNPYIHLQTHMLKILGVGVPIVFEIMIAHDKKMSPMQLGKVVVPYKRRAKRNIPQIEDDAILRDCIVPVLNENPVHLSHIRKRAVGELDDVLMTEMLVGGEKDLIGVKFCFNTLQSYNFLNLYQNFSYFFLGDARVPETTSSVVGLIKFVDFYENHGFILAEDHLGNPVTWIYCKGFL